MVQGQWFVDGAPMELVSAQLKAGARTLTFEYNGPLPTDGEHRIAFRILRPIATGIDAPTPAPDITYDAGAAVQPL